MKLGYGQKFVSFDEVPKVFHLDLLKQIIEHLELVILAEETPDYQSYTLMEPEP